MSAVGIARVDASGAMLSAVPTLHRGVFGATGDDRVVEQVELRTPNGTMARVITLGASLQALFVADRSGVPGDIVLGHDDAESYRAHRGFFGATVGRFANRIAGGAFTLDGVEYHLDRNDGANCLHGGDAGFDTRDWAIVEAQAGDDFASVTMRLVSRDGDGGFPGTLTIDATYRLDTDDVLTIDYRATADAPTMVSITHHSFFDLGGAGDVLDHRLALAAAAFTPVDADLIPTGERRPVAGTPFDFRTSAAIGDRIRDGNDEQIARGRGFDHNFIVDGEPGTLRPAARIEHRASGRVLELETTAPGLQFYTGNFLDGTVRGKGGRLYRQGDGLCLEPQHFPDSPNRPDFPSARLDPGDTYRNVTTLRFSILPE